MQATKGQPDYEANFKSILNSENSPFWIQFKKITSHPHIPDQGCQVAVQSYLGSKMPFLTLLSLFSYTNLLKSYLKEDRITFSFISNFASLIELNVY